MLSNAEQKVLDLLAKAWNVYTFLPIEHYSDENEFLKAIHSAQNIILSRPTLRYLKNEKNKEIKIEELKP